MSDLISRADAIALAEARAEAWAKATYATEDGRLQNAARVYAAYDIVADLRALPAVEVGVKPLEWFEVEKYRYGGKYTSEGYTIRYVEGFFILDFAGYGKAAWRFPTIEAAKAAAQSDYAARIRSALTVTPAPDAGKVEALVATAKAVLALDKGIGTRSTVHDMLDAALAAMKEVGQ